MFVGRLLLIIAIIYAAKDDKNKRRNKQGFSNDIRSERRPPKAGNNIEITQPVDNNLNNKNDLSDKIKNEADKIFSDKANLECIVSKDKERFSVYSFWNHRLVDSYYCAQDTTKRSKQEGLTQTLLYEISQRQAFREAIMSYSQTTSAYTAPVNANLPQSDAPPLYNWEILGPMPVSKFEVDGDPSFLEYDIRHTLYHDICSYILSMSSLTIPSLKITPAIVYSELSPSGSITWQPIDYNPHTNQVDVTFSSVNWQRLYQGVSTQAVLEFQGWARITTYVRSSGVYIIHCLGVHTVYIRNDNITRILNGDIYRNPDSPMTSTVELKAGVVGIVLPLRGAAQASFHCTLNTVKDYYQKLSTTTLNDNNSAGNNNNKPTLQVLSIYNIPHLLTWEKSTFPTALKPEKGAGLLLSPYFSVNLQNLDSHSVTVEVQVLVDGKYDKRCV